MRYRLSWLLVSVFVSLSGLTAAAIADPIQAGTTTNGGLVDGTQIIHVTTLADEGPGSLREAVAVRTPRVVVFDVAGVIMLQSELVVRAPYLTIAGQTAPSPGVTLTKAPLRIRTNDVVVQHIAVRQRPTGDPSIDGNLDALSIDGSGDRETNKSVDVLIENVSLSWSVDELLSLWYPTTSRVTVRDSILGEALQNAGHPKGAHAMGMLIGVDTGEIEVTGNLFISNEFRNPVVSEGASAAVYNNWVVNPGQNGIHLYTKNSDLPTYASIQNNVIVGQQSSKSNIVLISVPDIEPGEYFDARVFIDGNDTLFDKAGGTAVGYPSELKLLEAAPVVGISRAIIPATDVPAFVTRHAGARPTDRDATDRRFIEEASGGVGASIVDAPPETYAEGPSVFRTAAVPSDPFRIDPTTNLSRLAIWLCVEHLNLGGATSLGCPGSATGLAALLIK